MRAQMLRVEAHKAFEYVKTFRLGPSPKSIKKAGNQYEVTVPLITAQLQSKLRPLTVSFIQVCDSPPDRLTLRPVYSNIQCENCFSSDIRVDTHHGIRLCVECGHHIDDNVGDESSYFESYGPSRFVGNGRTLLTFPRLMRDDMTKRINHFRSWLLRIQGKELFDISSQDLDRISETCFKFNFLAPNYHDIRMVLKLCGLQCYNTHCYAILMHLTGVQPIQLTEQQHSHFIREFMRLQEPFYQTQHIHERMNFPSYGFVLHKLAIEAGWTELAYALPLTKSDPNMTILQNIWDVIVHRRDAGLKRPAPMREVDLQGC